MNFQPKFYRCAHCGQIVSMVKETGVPIICCGSPMQLLEPNTTDAAQEKHVPVVTRNGDELTVTIGSVLHPMLDVHHIEWIFVHTVNGGQRQILDITGAPEAKFNLAQGEAVEVYAYCNLHGLWMAKA